MAYNLCFNSAELKLGVKISWTYLSLSKVPSIAVAVESYKGNTTNKILLLR